MGAEADDGVVRLMLGQGSLDMRTADVDRLPGLAAGEAMTHYNYSYVPPQARSSLGKSVPPVGFTANVPS